MTTGMAADRRNPVRAPAGFAWRDATGRITETGARVLLAQQGFGGGTLASRTVGGWVFAPVRSITYDPNHGTWLVTDAAQVVDLSTVEVDTQILAALSLAGSDRRKWV